MHKHILACVIKSNIVHTKGSEFTKIEKQRPEVLFLSSPNVIPGKDNPLKLSKYVHKYKT
jgi:hypothetical protein